MFASPAPALRVLVLDGDHRQALAAVRSLGRRRARVVVAAVAPSVPAAASRFCKTALRCPDPHADATAYEHWIRDRRHRHRDDVLVFFDPATADILHRDALGSTQGVALPDAALWHASRLPQTVTAWAAEIGVASAPTHSGMPAALQRDYVLLALLRRGDPIASFVYRLRAAETEEHLQWFERSAGESDHQPRVRQLGLELLTRRRWHGVAALGFRHDLLRDRLTLLGMHPAWTDGLEFAIACGIDMPWLYAQLAAGHPITGPTHYRIGRKRRRVFSPPRATHASIPAPLTALVLDTGTDLFFQDPLPHLPTVERAAQWLRRHLRRPRHTGTGRHLHLVAGGRREPDDAANS